MIDQVVSLFLVAYATYVIYKLEKRCQSHVDEIILLQEERDKWRALYEMEKRD